MRFVQSGLVYGLGYAVRDAMGTVYGVDRLEELYTGTFVASFVLVVDLNDVGIPNLGHGQGFTVKAQQLGFEKLIVLSFA